MTDRNIDFYNEQAATLNDQYGTVDFTDVHRAWLSLFDPQNINLIVDIGAGNGRDAIGMHQHFDARVVAVEPAQALAAFGQQASESLAHKIQWVTDSLPALPLLDGFDGHPDLILLSAVFMHLPRHQYAGALARLKRLVHPQGHIVISLRNGAFHDARTTSHPVASEVAAIANAVGLSLVPMPEAQATHDDQLQRSDVTWETLVLTPAE